MNVKIHHFSTRLCVLSRTRVQRKCCAAVLHSWLYTLGGFGWVFCVSVLEWVYSTPFCVPALGRVYPTPFCVLVLGWVNSTPFWLPALGWACSIPFYIMPESRKIPKRWQEGSMVKYTFPNGSLNTNLGFESEVLTGSRHFCFHRFPRDGCNDFLFAGTWTSRFRGHRSCSSCFVNKRALFAS